MRKILADVIGLIGILYFVGAIGVLTLITLVYTVRDDFSVLDYQQLPIGMLAVGIVYFAMGVFGFRAAVDLFRIKHRALIYCFWFVSVSIVISAISLMRYIYMGVGLSEVVIINLSLSIVCLFALKRLGSVRRKNA